MLLQRAYRTELDPNRAQRLLFRKHAGVARFAYNWGLRRKIEHYEAWKAMPEEARGRYAGLSANELKREFNARKLEEFPWADEVSTYCMQSAMADLDKAFQNFFRRLKNADEKPGFPRFKSKARGLGSFRLYGCIHIHDTSIQLPRIGAVRLKERGYLPTGGVKIVSATVSEQAGRWYVSVQVEQEVPDPEPKPGVVGVDLGVNRLATLSDGTPYENPKALQRHLRKLKRLQRAVSRKQKGSANRKKAIRKLAKLHQRVANLRRNALHQATHEITANHGTAVLEDLNVRGMLKNRRLARAISDVGMYEFRRQMTYKAAWRGGRVVLADRWFPSSKTCSACGAKRETLKLSERVFHCGACGLRLDRDLNAARNLQTVVTERLPQAMAYHASTVLTANTQPLRCPDQERESVSEIQTSSSTRCNRP